MRSLSPLYSVPAVSLDPPILYYIMGCVIRISADPITLLYRLHCTVSDMALLCAHPVLTDAATEINPEELKKT